MAAGGKDELLTSSHTGLIADFRFLISDLEHHDSAFQSAI